MGAQNWKTARARVALAAALIGVGTQALPAHAQFSGSYLDTDVEVLSSATTPCAGAMVKTITVPDNVTITDVDVGMIIDHNNRGDTAAAIRHPDGTQVLLYFGSGGTLNDYNVLFDQGSASAVDTAPQNVNNNVGSAPYQFTVRPAASLNTFNGRNAQGDWLFLACDNANNGIDGQYLQSELFITGTQDFADLSLAMTADSLNPAFGSNVTLTLTVTHEAGTLATSGVQATFNLPGGLTFVSASGDGTFNDAIGLWDIGAIGVGGSATIDIIAEVMSTGSHASVAEITASTTTDPDSTPNNSGAQPAEDDTASVTLTPAFGGGTGPFG